MNRGWCFGLGVMLALGASTGTLAADLRLPSPAGEVRFSHHRHTGLDDDCVACHHTSRPGERMPSCRQCHGETGGAILSAPAALHASCIGCHDRLLRAGKRTGPSKRCSGCHAPRH